MRISPAQCRAARGLLNLSQLDVAKSAHVSDGTVSQFEQHEKALGYNNLHAIRTALEAAGIMFVTANGGGPGARLRLTPETVAAGETAISPEQCRAARNILNLSQTDLARAASVGRSTIADYERGVRTPNPDNLAALRSALEAAGVAFIGPNGGGPGVRLRE
jgi:transcriptional regulator with XRE-family HTH domain